MPAARTPMRQVREILRMKHEAGPTVAGFSRQIASIRALASEHHAQAGQKQGLRRCDPVWVG